MAIGAHSNLLARQTVHTISEATFQAVLSTASASMHIDSAMRLRGLGLAVWTLCDISDGIALPLHQAGACLVERGLLKRIGHQLTEAIADYGRAVELMQQQREILGAHWPTAFRNDLAAALRNRGNALERLGDQQADAADRCDAEALFRQRSWPSASRLAQTGSRG